MLFAELILTESAFNFTRSDLMTVVSESVVVTVGTTLFAVLILTECAVDFTRSDLMTVVSESVVATAGTTSFAELILTECAVDFTRSDLMTVVSEPVEATAGTTLFAELILTEGAASAMHSGLMTAVNVTCLSSGSGEFIHATRTGESGIVASSVVAITGTLSVAELILTEGVADATRSDSGKGRFGLDNRDGTKGAARAERDGDLTLLTIFGATGTVTCDGTGADTFV